MSGRVGLPQDASEQVASLRETVRRRTTKRPRSDAYGYTSGNVGVRVGRQPDGSMDVILYDTDGTTEIVRLSDLAGAAGFSLPIAESDVTGLVADLAAAADSADWGSITSKPSTFTPTPGSDGVWITESGAIVKVALPADAGQFLDGTGAFSAPTATPAAGADGLWQTVSGVIGRVAQSALSIAWSQLTGVPSVFTPDPGSDGVWATESGALVKVALPADASQYLDGSGAFSTPAGGGGGSVGAVYGDGSDGAVTLGSNITLSADKHYSSLNLNGFAIDSANFMVFVSGTLSGTGTIKCEGRDASGLTAGAARAAGTLGSSGAGGNGTSSAANGTGAAVISNVALGGGGSQGGAAGNTGGASGSTSLAAGMGSPRDLVRALIMGWFNSGTFTQYRAGAGGGGGGNFSGTSGGGGGGGGFVWLAAKTITATLTLSAKGGAGADASGSKSGGGGAGGGGVVVYIYGTISGSVSTDVSKGTEGAGSGTGVGGGVGGVVGQSGHVYSLQV